MMKDGRNGDEICDERRKIVMKDRRNGDEGRKSSDERWKK